MLLLEFKVMSTYNEENILSQITNFLINQNYLEREKFLNINFWFQYESSLNYGKNK